jgi:amino acid transporter
VLGVVNVCLIASAISAGNAFSFAASRVLVALAESSYAPIIFKKTYKETPIVAVLFTVRDILVFQLENSNGIPVCLQPACVRVPRPLPEYLDCLPVSIHNALDLYLSD